MIFIVTSKTDYTADFLILELKRLEIDFLRFNTEDFPQIVEVSVEMGNSHISGQIRVADKVVRFEEIRSIWYRRPALSIPPEDVKDSAAREFIIAESKETLEGLWRILPCFWVSHPDKLRVAESKLYQLMLASQLGFVIPDTLVTNSPETVEKFYKKNDQLIYKPMRRGQIVREENTGNIYTSLLRPEDTEHFDTVRLAPGLFQPYVPKKFELRVTVVGNRVFAVEIHSQEVDDARHDWRRVDPTQLRHIPHELREDVHEKCVELVQSLGITFGAIDMIVTPDEEYVFLEINPNGQWAWVEQICPEVRIREAMINLLLNTSK